MHRFPHLEKCMALFALGWALAFFSCEVSAVARQRARSMSSGPRQVRLFPRDWISRSPSARQSVYV